MKPYTNAILRKEQRFFKYRLRRARMVVEGSYGQLKGWWHLLLRESEGTLYQTKMGTLALWYYTACALKTLMNSQKSLT